MIGTLMTTIHYILPFKHKFWNFVDFRTVSRCHFQRPNEIKRVKQGYYARLTTSCGRKILMKRILKGRHLLGH